MLLLWLVLVLGQTPCEVGGKGAQCVTCSPSDRGTIVCRGVCYHKDPARPRPDGGFLSEPLKGEDKAEAGARTKVATQARELCE